MQTVSHALDEVKGLFQKVVGQPAPEIQPQAYAAFPPGVHPVDHTLAEVEYLKRLAEQVALAPAPPAWVPHADTFMADGAFVIRVEVPGVSREDLKVFVAGGECVVRGERRQLETAVQMRPMMLERPWGPFERKFHLPAGSDSDQVTARYQDGVLELRIAIDKVATPVEKQIDVA